MAVDEVGQIQVELPDGHVDMVRIYAQAGLRAVGILFESLPVGAFERYSLEQNDHDQVEPPNFVRLPETVYPPHLALLVGVREDADGRPLSRYAQYEVLPALLGDVLPQLAQQPGGPFLFDFGLLVLKRRNNELGVNFLASTAQDWQNLDFSVSLPRTGSQRLLTGSMPMSG